MTFGESDFIRMLESRLQQCERLVDLRVGIGDDAAVLATDGQPLVCTTDLLLDGVDFRLAECGYRLAGRKAMAKNLSDIAAMGVSPWCAFVSLALPQRFGQEDAQDLLDGVLGMCQEFDCPLVGGDTKRSSGPLVINVTLLGRPGAKPAVLRSGAVVGDALFVTGALGGSILGRHLDFQPRVAEGLRLNQRFEIHAMIDLSDGLSTDLARICDASGVGTEVLEERVPIAAAAEQLALQTGRSPLEHALHDGEDYELLFTAPPAVEAMLMADRVTGPLVRLIGRIVDPQQGRTLCRGSQSRPLDRGGFEHRFDDREPSP